jgi:trimethylamine:corrinoid methyltransferase-like protein
VRFPSQKALAVFAGNGCHVDRATQIVKIPRQVAMAAVAAAPRQYVLAGRDPACDLLIDGKHCYLEQRRLGRLRL